MLSRCARCLLLAVLYVASAGLPSASVAEAPRRATVAVADFEDRSGEGLMDIAGAAHSALETFLVGFRNVRVVTRDKLHTVLREQGFNVSGFTQGGARAGQIGRLLGADYIVTGAVTRCSASSQRLQAYGTNGLSVTYAMTANLQVVDLKSGELVLSRKIDTEKRELYPDASASPRGHRGMERVLMDAVVEQAAPDLRRLFAQGAAAEVAAVKLRIPVRTTPEGADVELDGVYLGSTPTTLEIEEGIHVIQFELNGYQQWKKKVKVHPSLQVDVRLTPLGTGSQHDDEP